MNSEEPFEARHFLSKTLELVTKSTRSASEWFLSTFYLSLGGLFPTVGQTKKAVIPTPGLFIERKYALSFNNLCRNIENKTYIASTKNRDTHTFSKKRKTTGDIVSSGQKYFAHTGTHTQKKTMKS